MLAHVNKKRFGNSILALNFKDGFDVVFGNPPYVRVKPEELAGFAMAKTRNLYCAFTELGLNLLNDQGLLCFIVPQSIVISKETMPLRKRLIEDSSSLRMQTFDSVPDFLFDQGKNRIEYQYKYQSKNNNSHTRSS